MQQNTKRKQPLKNSFILEDIRENPSTFAKILNYTTLAITIISYIIIIFLIIFNFDLVVLFFTDYTKLKEFFDPNLKFMIFAITFIFSIVLSISPFAQFVPFVSFIAFFYGYEIGTIFGMITFYISTYLTISLSRNLGSSIVIKIIGEKNWKRVAMLSDDEGAISFFIAYLFPIFPNAIISWVAGLTKISPTKLSLTAVIAQFPGILIAALIGSGLINKNPLLSVTLVLILIISSYLMHIKRNSILRLLRKASSENNTTKKE